MNVTLSDFVTHNHPKLENEQLLLFFGSFVFFVERYVCSVFRSRVTLSFVNSTGHCVPCLLWNCNNIVD